MFEMGLGEALKKLNYGQAVFWRMVVKLVSEIPSRGRFI